jgi:hypothetical protein
LARNGSGSAAYGKDLEKPVVVEELLFSHHLVKLFGVTSCRILGIYATSNIVISERLDRLRDQRALL